MPWIARLRDKDYAEQIRLSQKTNKESTVPMPPSFYEDDMQKVTQRTSSSKNTWLDTGNVAIHGNTNELQHLIKPKDKGSPTKADINFGFGLRTYRSEAKLRDKEPWKFPGIRGSKLETIDPTNIIHNKKGLKGSLSHRSTNSLNKRLKCPKYEFQYNDRFPQKNTNNIRHLFGRTSQLNTIKWEASLRWTSDKYAFVSNKTPGNSN